MMWQRIGRQLLVGALIATSSCAGPIEGADIRALIARNADALDASLVRLDNVFRQHPTDSLAVRAAFVDARLQYKRVEGVIEFYAPALAAALNSRRQEVDDDDAPPPSTLAPAGFPALEAVIWPSVGDSASAGRRIVAGMRGSVGRLRGLATVVVPTDPQLIELGRLELARISTLGIAGFDTPVTHAATVECAAALDGVRMVFAEAGAKRWGAYRRETEALDSTWRAASAYLNAQRDFDAFDRLEFIAQIAEPAARALDKLRTATRTVSVQIHRGWRADAPSVYGAGAFDPRAYAPTAAPPPSPAVIALGRRLFFDPALSGPGTRSCGSCHDPALAFADGRVRAAHISEAGAMVGRNTPTLINAALQPVQFSDERATTLEDQLSEVLRSPSEMAGSVDRAANALARNVRNVREFDAAFSTDGANGITPVRLRLAVAAYVRSLVTLDSRFDRAVRGDLAALSAEERAGFNLFMGKGGCGTCHFAPLFSGNTPPLYLSSDVEVIGTPVSSAMLSRLDPDSGRARIDHRPEHVRAFKTPTLRNIALTAPYMHNGAFATLDEVIRFYDGGGGRGAGAPIANQTLSADSLHLTGREREAIAAFLRALTDTSGTRP